MNCHWSIIRLKALAVDFPQCLWERDQRCLVSSERHMNISCLFDIWRDCNSNKSASLSWMQTIIPVYRLVSDRIKFHAKSGLFLQTWNSCIDHYSRSNRTKIVQATMRNAPHNWTKVWKWVIVCIKVVEILRIPTISKYSKVCVKSLLYTNFQKVRYGLTENSSELKVICSSNNRGLCYWKKCLLPAEFNLEYQDVWVKQTAFYPLCNSNKWYLIKWQYQ